MIMIYCENCKDEIVNQFTIIRDDWFGLLKEKNIAILKSDGNGKIIMKFEDLMNHYKVDRLALVKEKLYDEMEKRLPDVPRASIRRVVTSVDTYFPKKGDADYNLWFNKNVAKDTLWRRHEHKT